MEQQQTAHLTPPKTLLDWCQVVNEWCERKGWNRSLVVGNMVCNLHSEITEAWEEVRNNHSIEEIYFTVDKDGLLKPEGFPIELADEFIRIFHIFGHFGGLPMLEFCLNLKMQYNEQRPERHGGKSA